MSKTVSTGAREQENEAHSLVMLPRPQLRSIRLEIVSHAPAHLVVATHA